MQRRSSGEDLAIKVANIMNQEKNNTSNFRAIITRGLEQALVKALEVKENSQITI